MAEAPRAWRGAASVATPAGETPEQATGSTQAGTSQGARPSGRAASEAAQAERSFHRALAAERQPPAAERSRRSAAVQSFFVANAGRSLLPSGETSGAMSPQLKSEEP